MATQNKVYIVLKGYTTGLLSGPNAFDSSMTKAGSVGHAFRNMREAKEWLKVRMHNSEFKTTCKSLLKLPDSTVSEEMIEEEKTITVMNTKSSVIEEDTMDDLRDATKTFNNYKPKPNNFNGAIVRHVSKLVRNPVIPVNIELPEIHDTIVAQRVYMPKRIILYTDGSFGITNTSRSQGGFGLVFVKYNGVPFYECACHSEENKENSSMRMEYAAIYTGLKMIAEDHEEHDVVVKTDCKNIVTLFSNITEDTILDTALISDYGDLIEKIYELLKNDKLHVTFIKVNAHTGNRYNEKCDHLARLGAITHV